MDRDLPQWMEPSSVMMTRSYLPPDSTNEPVIAFPAEDGERTRAFRSERKRHGYRVGIVACVWGE
ncbi:MAG: hypothetical protein BGO89_00845 [Candidatus Kapaibacterium thiocyanatum]|uniref:Uncharacterized protein n=1 Tax=Candidatus Kapaibacterium thiocyanatum TaxID=1895771 RepID=A0A1M3L6H8_9BACT|nr:MAG: hypothetical protein BGO89_00845 ['Candidatus Kapabacteria' thiocyanatum]